MTFIVIVIVQVLSNADIKDNFCAVNFNLIFKVLSSIFPKKTYVEKTKSNVAPSFYSKYDAQCFDRPFSCKSRVSNCLVLSQSQ